MPSRQVTSFPCKLPAFIYYFFDSEHLREGNLKQPFPILALPRLFCMLISYKERERFGIRDVERRQRKGTSSIALSPQTISPVQHIMKEYLVELLTDAAWDLGRALNTVVSGSRSGEKCSGRGPCGLLHRVGAKRRTEMHVSSSGAVLGVDRDAVGMLFPSSPDILVREQDSR